jgi:hypothetical protein
VLDEYGKGQSEEALLADLLSEYSHPEPFESASQCRVFSFGGGHRGVQMMQHGAAWLGLISGAKLWHVAAPHEPRPSNIECADGGRIDYARAKAEHVSHCLLLPGEMVWVPERWWHATCNLDPYTIGVGGQLWRAGAQDTFMTAAERQAAGVSFSTEPSFSPDTDVADTPLPDRSEPIIFDPHDGGEPAAPATAAVGVDARGGQAAATPACADADAACATWAAEGECDANPAYMHAACGVSCSTCGRASLGGRTRVRWSEAFAAGVSIPREVHAWPKGEDRMVDIEHIGPGMTGAPRNASFELPGAYKRDGCDLWRIDVRQTELTRELLEGAPFPFIIDGLTANWSALEGWRREAILAEHGDAPYHLHSTYSKTLRELLEWEGKYHMGHAVYPKSACYSDPWRPYTPMLFDHLAASYHVPPYFHPMSTFQMGIGSGAGVGVPPENHPSSWFASVIGRKRWLLHPDTELEPEEMMRYSRGRDCKPEGKMESTLECVQNEGEVIWVPSYWWHETCGMDAFSAGIGGITYKGCCADLIESNPEGHDCKQAKFERGFSYGIDDIPHCKEHHCGTL